MTDLLEPFQHRTMLGIVIVVAAAAIAAILIIQLKPWLVRYALARPNGRSSHTAPTPQGGGMAVVVATLAATLIAVLIAAPAALTTLASVLIATAFIAALGAVDDIRNVGVMPRLLFQTLAVGIVIAGLPADLTVTSFLPWWVERALLLVSGIWFVNLVNFMDGLDWMTVAEVLPVTAGLVLLSAFGALPLHGTVLALALFGAMLGFAPFNRPVARLFLGDVGSLPIGLLLGYLLALLAGRGHVIAALLLPLYYLADATITLLRRLKNGEQVWQAHRTHFYQLATNQGFMVSQIVGRVFAVNLGLVALAVLSVWQTGLMAQVIALALGSGLVAWLLMTFSRGRG